MRVPVARSGRADHPYRARPFDRARLAPGFAGPWRIARLSAPQQPHAPARSVEPVSLRAADPCGDCGCRSTAPRRSCGSTRRRSRPGSGVRVDARRSSGPAGCFPVGDRARLVPAPGPAATGTSSRFLRRRPGRVRSQCDRIQFSRDQLATPVPGADRLLQWLVKFATDSLESLAPAPPLDRARPRSPGR